VNFACSGMPTGVTCSAPAATVAANGTATSMITFTASSSANVAPLVPGADGISNHGAPSLTGFSRHMLPALFAVTIIFWGGLFVLGPRKRAQLGTAAFALVIFGAIFVASCGGGGGNTPPPPPTKTANVLVTGTSGNATGSTIVTLTVQ
jgi:hypothetical protein